MAGRVCALPDRICPSTLPPFGPRHSITELARCLGGDQRNDCCACLEWPGYPRRLVALFSFRSQDLAAVPLSLRVAIVLTAAFCEEFMYRGFGIEELTLLTRSRWLAGILSLVFFTLAHAGLYGFSAALVIPGVTGAVLTLLYLWRRNLFSCILMHTLIDGLFVVLIPALMAASSK
jgi:membrane protease YdiL (CAAX protease family)